MTGEALAATGGLVALVWLIAAARSSASSDQPARPSWRQRGRSSWRTRRRG